MKHASSLKPAVVLMGCLLAYGCLLGQTQTSAQQEAVLAPIYDMFDAMRAGDTTRFRALFHEQASLLSAYRMEASSQVKAGSLDAFIQALGSPHDQPWNERIWALHIQLDRDLLATVWMRYAFFLGTSFHHCGINSFTLLHSDDGWKILHIVDTRFQTDCDLPDTYVYPSGG